MLERRIRALRTRLAQARSRSRAQDDGLVGVGIRVEIEDESGERMEVEISSVGGVSPDSPLGSALMGKKVGDAVDVQAPRGAWRATVRAVRPV